MDERRNDVCINDSLDLSGVASGDVGNSPAGLLADSVLARAQEREESWQGTAINDDLCLDIITSNNITDRSQSRGLDGGRCMHEQLDKATRDTGFDDSLDLIVRAIGEVGNSPTRINQDFIVQGVDELRQDRESGQDLLDMLACCLS